MTQVIQVVGAVRQLLGSSENECFDIVPYVKAACGEIHARLKDESFENDARVINACVYLSYYRITLNSVLSGECAQSFKAGDITVSQTPALSVENAARLRDEALISAAPLLTDTDFMFRQV
jgi:hypothetical protein